LVRFADSGGFERDYDWLNAWRYRDYVVKAFNDDKPYDVSSASSWRAMNSIPVLTRR